MPGWSDRARRLRWLHSDLLAHGWPASHVAALEFRDRYGGNIDHAAEIAASARALIASTGSPRLDIVAHSMGGLAVRYYLHFGDGARDVRRVAFTATPHAGTWAAYLAWGAGGADMRPGSPFLRRLASLPAVPPGVQALCLHTPAETRVFPHKSALLPDVRCQRVWSVSHPRMLRSRRVFAAIRAFLREPVI